MLLVRYFRMWLTSERFEQSEKEPFHVYPCQLLDLSAEILDDLRVLWDVVGNAQDIPHDLRLDVLRTVSVLERVVRVLTWIAQRSNVEGAVLGLSTKNWKVWAPQNIREKEHRENGKKKRTATVFDSVAKRQDIRTGPAYRIWSSVVVWVPNQLHISSYESKAQICVMKIRQCKYQIVNLLDGQNFSPW